MRPFFSFYGAKWRAAKYYPAPKHENLIEPFAGSAGYATRYPELQVILIERDPVIAELWQYIINTPSKSILDLPLDPRERKELENGAQSLIGFWLNKGTTSPSKNPSAWMRTGNFGSQFWGPEIRERVATQAEQIRHWRIINANYEEAPDIEATWFIDPPYSTPAGQHYKYNELDYIKLGQWCQERKGQTIVCEQRGAKWLPFQEFRTLKANVATGKSHEVVWTNG